MQSKIVREALKMQRDTEINAIKGKESKFDSSIGRVDEKLGEDVAHLSKRIMREVLKTVPFHESESRFDHYMLLKELEKAIECKIDCYEIRDISKTRDLKEIEVKLRKEYQNLIDKEYELASKTPIKVGMR